MIKRNFKGINLELLKGGIGDSGSKWQRKSTLAQNIMGS